MEGAGASKIGSVFIYLLVAIIGMKMDITKALEQPLLIVVGLIWMISHFNDESDSGVKFAYPQ